MVSMEATMVSMAVTYESHCNSVYRIAQCMRVRYAPHLHRKHDLKVTLRKRKSGTDCRCLKPGTVAGTPVSYPLLAVSHLATELELSAC